MVQEPEKDYTSLQDLEEKLTRLRREFDNLLFKDGFYESCRIIYRKIKMLETLKAILINVK